MKQKYSILEIRYTNQFSRPLRSFNYFCSWIQFFLLQNVCKQSSRHSHYAINWHLQLNCQLKAAKRIKFATQRDKCAVTIFGKCFRCWLAIQSKNALEINSNQPQRSETELNFLAIPHSRWRSNNKSRCELQRDGNNPNVGKLNIKSACCVSADRHYVRAKRKQSLPSLASLLRAGPCGSTEIYAVRNC